MPRAGFSLSFAGGGALAVLEGVRIADLCDVERLELEIPGVSFPIDLSGGANQFRHRYCALRSASIKITEGPFESYVSRCHPARFGIRSLHVRFDDAVALLSGRIVAGEHVASFTVRVAVLPGGEPLSVDVVAYDVRLYGWVPIPVPLVGATLLRLITGGLAETEEEGHSGALVFGLEPLRPILLEALPPLGWKLPDTRDVRIAEVSIQGGAFRLQLTRGIVAAADAEQSDAHRVRSAAVELAGAEKLLFRGDLPAAITMYRRANQEAADGSSVQMHARRRLIALLAADPRTFDAARVLCDEELTARPDAAAARTALAGIALRLGELEEAVGQLELIAENALSAGEEVDAVAARTLLGEALSSADPDRALRQVEAALHIRRRHVPALEVARRLYGERGEWKRYVAVARRLVLAERADRERSVRRLIDLGRVLAEKLSDAVRAREQFERALRLDPDNVDALAGIAETFVTTSDFERALRALDRAVAAEDDISSARKAELERRAGEILFRSLNDRDAAEARLRVALELLPRDPFTLSLLAEVEGAAGRWESAAAHYEDALRTWGAGHGAEQTSESAQLVGSEPMLATAEVRLAEIYLHELDEPREAEEHLVAAVRRAPQAGEPTQLLAGLLEAQGRFAEAAEVLEQRLALDLEPNTAAELLLRAGSFWVKGGQPDRASDAFARAASAGARSEAYRAEVELHRSRGDWVRLRETYQCILQEAVEPGERSEVAVALATLQRDELGDPGGAITWFRRAVEEQPGHLDALEQLIQLLRSLHDATELAKVLPSYAKALEEAGEWAAAAERWMEHASILAQTPGNAAERIAVLQRVRDLGLERQVLSLLAEAYRAEGMYAEARQALERFGEILGGEAEGADVERAAIHWRLAKLAHAQGDLELEATHLSAACESGGDDVELLAAIGARYEEQSAWREAADIHGRLSELRDDGRERIAELVAAARIRLVHLVDPDGAGALLSRALESHPDHLEALQLAAEVLPALDRLEEYAEVLARLGSLDKEPEARAEWLVQRATVLSSALDNNADALRALESVVALVPDHLDGLSQLARLLIEAAQWERASEALERLFAALSSRSSPSYRARVLLTRAKVARHLERFDLSIEHLRSALELDENLPEALAELERLHRARAEWPELHDVLLRRLAVEPAPEQRAPILREVAELEERELAQGKEALARWLELEELAPDDPQPSLRAARLHEQEGDADKATDALQRAAAAFDRQGDEVASARAAGLLVEAGELTLRALGDAPKAMQLYRAALAAGPTPDRIGQVLDSLDELAEATGDTRARLEAIDLRLARVVGAVDRARLLVRRGELVGVELGDPGPAAASLQPVLADETLPPDVLRLAMDLAARLATARGRLQEAAAWHEGLAQLCEDQGDTSATLEHLRTLARIRREHLADPAGAAAVLSRIQVLDPTSAEAAETLAEIARGSGDVPEAIRCYEAAVAAADAGGDDEAAVRSLCALAELAEQELGDLAFAAERLAEAVRFRPTDPELVRTLARVREDLQDWAGAADAHYALAALESNPDQRAEALHKAASLRQTFLGDPIGAAAAFSQAAAAWAELDAHERAASSLEGLAVAERLAGHYRGAAAAWSRRVVLDDEHPGATDPAAAQQAMSALADALVELGAWKEAAGALRRLYRAGEPSAQGRLIQVLSAAGEWRGLAELLEERAGSAAEQGRPELEATYRQQAGEVWAFFVGDLERGLRHLERAFELAPDDARVLAALLDALGRAQQWTRLHHAAEGMGDRSAAARALERLYESDPKPETALRIGEAWKREPARLERARQWLRRAMSDGDPRARASALVALAGVARIEGRDEEELRALAERLGMPDEEARAAPNTDDLTRLATLAKQAGDRELERQALERLLVLPDADPPERLEAAAQLAAIHHDEDRGGEAIDLLAAEAASLAAPTNRAAVLLARAGAIAEGMGDADRSARLFELAEEKSLGAALRVDAFRRYFARRGEWARLEQSALEEAQGDPMRIAAALVRLGCLARDEAGDLDRARELLMRAVSLQPHDRDALETAAAVLAELGEGEALGELFADAVERASPGVERAEALLAYGEALLRHVGDARAARRALLDSRDEAAGVEATALSARALGLCGEATARAGNDEEAAVLLREAAQCDEVAAATRARWLALAADSTRRTGNLMDARHLAAGAARLAASVEGDEAQRLACQAEVAVARAQGDAHRALTLLEERRVLFASEDELLELGPAGVAEAVALAISAGDIALHDLHDAGRAAQEYRAALLLEPASQWAVLALVETFSSPGAKPSSSDWEEVAEHLGAAADALPPGTRRADLKREHAEVRVLHLGDEKGAREILIAAADELATAGVPSAVSQRRHRAELLISAEQYDAALEILQSLSVEPDVDPDHCHRECEVLVAVGRLVEALERYVALYETGDRRAAAPLAIVYRRLGHEEARAELLLREAERCIEEGSVYQATSVLAYAARTLVTLGSQDRAIAALEKAAALTQQPNVVDTLVEEYRAAGRFDALLELYESTLESLAPEPRARRLATMAAVAGSDLGKVGEAARLYAEALEVDSGCPPALAYAGAQAAERGDWSGARNKLEGALKQKDALGMDATAILELRLVLARAQRATGDVDSARQSLDKVLGAAPDNLGAIDARIELCREEDEAAVLVEMLLRRRELRDPPDPGLAAADLAEAERRVAAGGVPEFLVVRTALEAIAARPDDAVTVEAALDACSRANNWDELDEVIASLLERDPGEVNLIAARARVMAEGRGDPNAAETTIREALATADVWRSEILRDYLWRFIADRGDAAALERFLHESLADERYAATHAGALWTALADVRRHGNDWAGEAAALEEAVALAEPGEERARLRACLGRALLRADDEEGAADAFVEAFREAPGAVPDGMRIAREVHMRARNLERVVELLVEEADRADPTARGILLLERAKILDEELGDRAGAMAALSAAIALNPDDGDAHRKLGLMRLDADALEEALQSLQIAVRSSPEDRDLWRALARAHEGLGRLDEQADALISYVHVDPTDATTARELEGVLAQLGRWDDVADVLQLRAANAMEPGEAARLLWRRAQVLRDRIERPAEAYVALREAHRLDPEARPILSQYRDMSIERQEWRTVDELLRVEHDLSDDPLERARLAVQRGQILADRLLNLRAAMQVNREALQLDPDRVEPGRRALWAIAELAEKLGEWEEAERALAELLELAAALEQRALLALRLGRAREKLGSSAAAAEAYRIAAQCPGTDEAVSALAALRRGSATATPAERVEMLRQLLQFEEDEEDRAGLLRELARAYVDAGEREQAVTAYERLLSAQPTDEEAFDYLRRMLVQRGFWAELSRLYERRGAATTDVSERAAFAYEGGRVLLEKIGSSDEARTAFRRALSYDPEYLPALEALAELYYQKQDWKNADDMLRRLAGRSARFGSYEYLCRRAEIAEALKRGDEAVRLYRSAFEANPGDLVVAEALARLYGAVGDVRGREEMLNHLLAHLRIDFDRDRLAEVHAALAEVRLSQGANEEARRHLRAVLEFEPERLDVFAALADVNYRLGRHEEAAQDYLRVAPRVRERRTRQSYLMNAADVYGDSLGDREKELDVLLRAYDEDPSNLEVAVRLFRVYDSRGDWEALQDVGLEVLSTLDGDSLDGESALLVARANRLAASPEPALAARLLAAAMEQLQGTELEDVVSDEDSALRGQFGELAVAVDATWLPGEGDASELAAGAGAPTVEAPDIAEAAAVPRADPDHYRQRAATLGGPGALSHIAVARYCLGAEAAEDLRRGAWPLLPTSDSLRADEGPGLAHAEAGGPARALLELSAPLLDGLFDAEVPDGEDVTGPLAAELVDLRGRLGMRAVVVKVTDTPGLAVIPHNSPSACVTLGRDVPGMSTHERVFLLARALEATRTGVHLLSRLAPTEAMELLLYVCRALSPATTVVDSSGLGEGIGAQIDAMIGLSSDEELERIAEAVEDFLDVAQDLDAEAWVNAMQFSADRVGLAACGDLAAALTAMARLEGWARGDPLATPEGRGEVLAESPAMRELVRHATGEELVLVELDGS